jgi:ABC-type molybdenum transport system ATPase subunit/photorepair protein PhrA
MRDAALDEASPHGALSTSARDVIISPPMADKIIFQLQDCERASVRRGLKGITSAFLEGRKIGVIGSNGAGKSTLLRIIAAEDKKFDGSAGDRRLSIGYSRRSRR